MMNHGADSTCKIDLKSHPEYKFTPRKYVYNVNEYVVVQCAKDSNSATLRCNDDGSFHRSMPACKASEEDGCEYSEQFRSSKWPTNHYKYVNISVPRREKVGNNNKDIVTSKGISDSTTSGFMSISASPASESLTAKKDTKKLPLRSKVSFQCEPGYTLIGPNQIVCDVKYEWTYKAPWCKQDDEIPEKQAINYKLTLIWSSITIVSILVLIVSSLLIYKWRQRILQRKQWQRYFGDYTYRQSKTRITRPGSAAAKSNRKSTAVVTSANTASGTVTNTTKTSDVQVSKAEDTATIYSTATITSVSTTMTSITPAIVTITAPSPDLNDVVSPPSPSVITSDPNPVYAHVNVTIDNNISSDLNNPLESPSGLLSEQELKNLDFSRRSPVVPVTDL